MVGPWEHSVFIYPWFIWRLIFRSKISKNSEPHSTDSVYISFWMPSLCQQQEPRDCVLLRTVNPHSPLGPQQTKRCKIYTKFTDMPPHKSLDGICLDPSDERVTAFIRSQAHHRATYGSYSELPESWTWHCWIPNIGRSDQPTSWCQRVSIGSAVPQVLLNLQNERQSMRRENHLFWRLAEAPVTTEFLTVLRNRKWASFFF